MTIQANYLEQILGDNQEAKFAIREVPHFVGCSNGLLDLVYTYGRVYSLQEGESLTREGEFDQWVYFVLSGGLVVNVEGEQVDTISSSMVGESCIFGEARKATLNAREGGVVALGIDMAVLDTLQGANGNATGNIQVYIELLSIITEEIIDRIADLAAAQLNVASKLAVNIKAEEVADIIDVLIANSYSGDPQLNIAIYKHLMKRDKGLLALSLEPDRITVNTRKFYSHCVNLGRPELALELAQIVYDIQQGRDASDDGTTGYLRRHDFHSFAGDVFRQVAEVYETIRGDQQKNREITETGWREHFRMDGDLRINLTQLCNWLRSAYRFTDFQLVDVLVKILQTASVYTTEINNTNREIMVEISQIKGLKKLEAITGGMDIAVSLYFDTRTPEEMIPLFSKHVLEVHLINPYLERVGKPALVAQQAGGDDAAPLDGAAADATPPAAGQAGETKDILDSLFD